MVEVARGPEVPLEQGVPGQGQRVDGFGGFGEFGGFGGLSSVGRFPQDFKVPLDQGGPPYQQVPVGGFGGNEQNNRDGHRAVVRSVGKAPIILIHGNGGTADVGQWAMTPLSQMLLKVGYQKELIWAPSYLGTISGFGGIPDIATPHTDNVNEVREFIDNVCEYLGVDVVDIIAHSLGCTLAYSIFRGLRKQTSPISWDQPKKWNKVGTFVALAGAFHGLGPNSFAEWKSDGEFMRELRTETLGGGGDTPFGEADSQTPPPAPHNITYFCGVARGDFIDSQKRDTGFLDGATNIAYDLGSGATGHQEIKENQKVFNDFLPLLNSVPPIPAVTMSIDKHSGDHDSPLRITADVDPGDIAVGYVANRVRKVFLNGYIVDKVVEASRGTLGNSRTLTLHTDGMWKVAYSADGAVGDESRTYWVGRVTPIEVTIVTDSFTFKNSLDVKAETKRGKLYHSLDGELWNEGDEVTITKDAVVHFIAIDSHGVASEVVSRSFGKAGV